MIRYSIKIVSVLTLNLKKGYCNRFDVEGFKDKDDIKEEKKYTLD